MEKAFKKYLVWQRAHELAVEIYKTTQTFQKEKYWLASQLQRASFSVAVNFVEGYARGGTKEFLRFLSISHGSLSEVEYELLFARDVEVINSDQYKYLESKRSEVGFLLRRFMDSLKEHS